MQKSISILIVDDDATIRMLLETAFTKKGFKVLSASNGRQGLEIAKSEEIDVILLDWMMPEMDGIEVLTELKHNSNTMYIPVFMLTSKENSGDIEYAIGKGAADYIVKPFNAFIVPEMVQKHLEKVHHDTKAGKQGFFSKIFSR